MSDVGRVLRQAWDPIGHVPDDEYDSYVPHVAGLLFAAADRVEVAGHLYRLETVSMGLPGDRPRCARVADELLSLRTPAGGPRGT